MNTAVPYLRLHLLRNPLKSLKSIHLFTYMLTWLFLSSEIPSIPASHSVHMETIALSLTTIPNFHHVSQCATQA